MAAVVPLIVPALKIVEPVVWLLRKRMPKSAPLIFPVPILVIEATLTRMSPGVAPPPVAFEMVPVLVIVVRPVVLVLMPFLSPEIVPSFVMPTAPDPALARMPTDPAPVSWISAGLPLSGLFVSVRADETTTADAATDAPDAPFLEIVP